VEKKEEKLRHLSDLNQRHKAQSLHMGKTLGTEALAGQLADFAGDQD
jgi:hypothetical protein